MEEAGRTSNTGATTVTDTSAPEREREIEDFLEKVTHWGSRSSKSPSPRKIYLGISMLNVLTSQPAMKLKPYQLEGVKWILEKHNAGVNCILADEMVPFTQGLGKTIQTIAYFACVKQFSEVSGPHLIVVPKSVQENWRSELACDLYRLWCPSFRTVVLVSTKDKRGKIMKNQMQKDMFDICITSYEGLSICRYKLRTFTWQLLVVDEAHKIKNNECLLREHLMTLRVKRKLLLTGTPMQMNLKELWSLLNFLAPDLFDSLGRFEDWFSAKRGSNSELIMKRIRQAISPFILRRIKAEVETTLPPKKEIHITVGLSRLQLRLYKELLATRSLDFSRAHLNNLLMQLRKVCNHPYLFPDVEDPGWDESQLIKLSGKTKILDKLLKELKAAHSKVLLFSQMTRMLDILEDYCDFRGFKHCRLDGTTPLEDRVKQIEEFNDPSNNCFLFLLSTRAGGLGINLASADTVILYDSDWNPQVDLQAMDRAHRIGQTKQVNVLRLITKGTVEEKIIERQLLRLKLGHMVMEQGVGVSVGDNLFIRELKEIVNYGADAMISSTGDEQALANEDLEAMLQRGEAQAALLESKVEETLRSKQESLADFESMTDFFRFESRGPTTSGPVPTTIEGEEDVPYPQSIPQEAPEAPSDPKEEETSPQATKRLRLPEPVRSEKRFKGSTNG